MADYPLLLDPHLAERVWGGARLGAGIGEAWDLSVHPNGPSRVRNGPLAGRALADLDPAAFGGPIELLAKRLDCAEDLSVQVHPPTGDPKTEAWVTLAAEPGAGVYHGFVGTPSRDEVRRAAEDGSIPDHLRFVEVSEGDAVFVPSGTVHAIGGGLFLFEIQQSADTTYRLFDWGRGRELHLETGLACSDLASPPPDLRNGAGPLVTCEHFAVDRIAGNAAWTLDPGAKWMAVFVEAGAVTVGDVRAAAGETVLLPQTAGTREVVPDAGTRVLRYGPCRL